MSGAVYWFICSRESYPSALPTVSSSQVNFNRQVVNAYVGLRKSRHGIGDLLARPNSNAVADHLLCDGTAVGRLAFPQLFAEIGTDWGAGDGSTTFNLPDLVSEALPLPSTTPTQTVDSGGTVSTGQPVVQPTEPGQTGGSTGGNVPTGGRNRKFADYDTFDIDPNSIGNG